MQKKFGVAWLVACFGLSACQTVSPPKLLIRPDKEPVKVLRNDPNKSGNLTGSSIARTTAASPKDVAQRFLDDYTKSWDLPNDGSLALQMMISGMRVMDLRCDMFFESIGTGSQRLDFLHREAETLTGALIAALGVANVGKDWVTGVGIGSNLALRSLDNFNDVFFFSPDVAAVQKLVKTAEDSVRTLARSAGHSPATYDDAIGYLRDYQNLCTAHQIKALVNASVETASKNVGASFTSSGTPSDPIRIAIDARLQVLANQLHLAALSLDQIALLKWAKETGTDAKDAGERMAICSALHADVHALFCKDGVVTIGADANGDLVKQALLDISHIDNNGIVGDQLDQLKIALQPFVDANDKLAGQIQGLKSGLQSAGANKAALQAQLEQLQADLSKQSSATQAAVKANLVPDGSGAAGVVVTIKNPG
ncbi:hypothetical protein FHS31_001871 [Sphingomonas vulcanisoli]|uniref:Lipoprotein n=1 Tax=Sphingomonas vulcanisoli TaxID=1658060 RepID=A0ABX0TVR6_9SPHN|nr:hypothetical protein [Sphingomonas vulcanisoli]NIJ08254.1 hypothetical protein [Sphingomonas vulcanisoli]